MQSGSGEGTGTGLALPHPLHPSRALSSLLAVPGRGEGTKPLLQALPGSRNPAEQHRAPSIRPSIHPCSHSLLLWALPLLSTLHSTNYTNYPLLHPYPTRAGGHSVPVQQGSINKCKHRNENSGEGAAGRASGTKGMKRNEKEPLSLSPMTPQPRPGTEGCH